MYVFSVCHKERPMCVFSAHHRMHALGVCHTSLVFVYCVCMHPVRVIEHYVYVSSVCHREQAMCVYNVRHRKYAFSVCHTA